MKKTRSVRNTCYGWLNNYIPEPIRKTVSDSKDKIMSLYKTNVPKQTVYMRGKKLSKPRKQNTPEKKLFRGE